jgi:hypothetical protein
VRFRAVPCGLTGGIIKGAYDDPRVLGGHPLFVSSAEGCSITDVRCCLFLP